MDKYIETMETLYKMTWRRNNDKKNIYIYIFFFNAVVLLYNQTIIDNVFDFNNLKTNDTLTFYIDNGDPRQ